eukprot:Phypoly_transcript_01311.p1 GENE.Phypoly_transcript_01311~~Phypoly_transcript_01311.p1  ORF type:complete len:1119 (+),score=253.28 Phypoly_transcript_01311:35-3391(+)
MGAGCSAQTSAHDPQRARPHAQQTSSTRLISALGGMAAGLNDQPAPPASIQGSTSSQSQISSPQAPSPQVTSPDLFPTPIPSPAHTPLAHVLSPGVEIEPLPDQPLLRQRQTIPPMIDLDRSTGLSRIQSEQTPAHTDAVVPIETVEHGMFKASTFPIKLPSSTPELNKDKFKLMDARFEREDANEDGSTTSGMSRASSDEPPASKILVPPEISKRRNSISVLPSIDPKPKFPGSTGGEGKKTDPDLVLWISNKLKTKLKLTRISKAYDRFIPSNFYSEMGKQDIREVDLGECVIVRKSILFCDIRNFTSFSSKIGPQDTFKFINAFSRRLLPVVRKHGGYIDKFIGDALVALFPAPAQGIAAGHDILHALDEYNLERYAKALTAVRVGIGCHTGTLMLGTVGDTQRMDGIAIGNVISLASQVEMCTKLFGVDFITTKLTFMGLKDEDKVPFMFRRLGRIKEGTDDDQLTDIYQVCPAKSPLASTKDRFEEAVNLFQQKDFAAAVEIFRECIEKNPNDKPSLVLADRAQHFLACTYLPADCGNALTYHTEFMTQSTTSGVLANQPASGFPSMGGGGANSNLGLMRLVFSAIFHMQKKLSENDEQAEEEGEEGGGEGRQGEGEKTKENPGETTLEVPNGRVTLPPISPTKSAKNVSNGTLPKTESASAQKPPASPASGQPSDAGKERELITLVLSGFENHNRVSYLTKAYQRFVPNDFLSYLGKDNVQHVDIGDSMMTNITTMFIEIHGFQPKTRIISEKTFNQLQNMKRFSDPSPSSSSSSSSAAPQLPTPKPALSSSRNQTLQPAPSSQNLQPTPSSQTLSSASSNRRLGRMASRNTVNLRADYFSFQFLNTISQKLLPIIRQCDGYVDKFFGNAILALFPNLDAATSAGLQVMAAVKSFESSDESEDNHAPYAQIGMNSGNVILGTVGDGKRMDGTVIGNTVNVAARMLSLTKVYGVKFITTSKCIAQIGHQSSSTTTHTPASPPLTHAHSSSPPHTLPTISDEDAPPAQPKNPGAYKFYNQRVIDTVCVPGKEDAIVVHEIFDNESLVGQIKPTYESAIALYKQRRFDEALKLFENVLERYPEDVPSQMMRDRCARFMREGVPADWDGVHMVSVK